MGTTSPTRALLVAACVLLLVVSPVTPVALSDADTGAATDHSRQLPRSPAPAGAATDATDFPPGTSATGIDNVTRLTTAHQSALANDTYRTQAEWDQVSGWSSGEFDAVPVSMTVASGPNGSLVRLGGDGIVNEYWTTSESTAMKTSFDGVPAESTYAYYDSGFGSTYHDAAVETLGEWLNASTYDYTGTVTRDNRTLHEFWADGLRGNSTGVEDAHGRVLVDRDGVVHRATVTRTHRRENETATSRLNYTVRRTGTPPPTRPDWVTAELPHLNGTVIRNGTVVAIEHTGGATVRNATLRAFFSDRTRSDEAVEDFEPGDTLYLYREASAPERIRLSENEAPAANTSLVPVGDDSVLVSVFDYPASVSESDDHLLIEVEPGNG